MLHGHEMTIPTTSTDADKLTNILKTFSANKWQYLLLSIRKPSRSVMALFIIGSWIYIFEPPSWLPTILGLSTLNYCATPMSCAMYLQCVGKH